MENPLSVLPLSLADAERIAGWRYEAPYDLYNVDGDIREHARRLIEDSRSRCYAIYSNGELTGFCSYGLDGQVPGGPYDTAATDIGMSIRPDLTGQGLGSGYVKAVCDFARCELGRTPALLKPHDSAAATVWSLW